MNDCCNFSTNECDLWLARWLSTVVTPRERKTIIELLAANHPDDCLYCERNGTCQLQKPAEELGVHSRTYYGVHNLCYGCLRRSFRACS